MEIWNKGVDDAFHSGKSAAMEGAHMYKIDGMYYILCPAGGTAGWQVCLRSKNIYGPYEHKVVLQDDSSYPENGLHQGGMVQLRNGEWWFIIMQDRGAIGRVPHLLPVKWVGGWPIPGIGGKDATVYRKPDVGRTYPTKAPATTDEFSKTRLGLQWQWNHNPDNAQWSLSERKGYMRLKALPAKDLTNARNTLTQRVQGPLSTGTVEMDVTGLKDGNVAGFGVFQNPYAYVAVRQEKGIRQLAVCHNGKTETVIVRLNQDKVWSGPASPTRTSQPACTTVLTERTSIRQEKCSAWDWDIPGRPTASRCSTFRKRKKGPAAWQISTGSVSTTNKKRCIEDTCPYHLNGHNPETDGHAIAHIKTTLPARRKSGVQAVLLKTNATE